MAYAALSPADLARIRRISLYWAATEDAAEELRQEAIFRALDGTRRCPRNVDLVRFLALVMKSMAWSERKTAARRPTVELETADHALAADQFGVDIHEHVAGRLECEAIRGSILALFSDHPTAQTVAEGIMEEMEGAELCELAEIDKDELATIRKLFLRRVSAAFPRGWCHDE